jgi:DNA-binding transcriptional MerR regulator
VDNRRYTLDELAGAAGMTVRNVRAYQTRGLLPGPARRGRRAVYTGEHLLRLEAIHRARDRGASLGLISAHLADGGSLSADTLERAWLPSQRMPSAPQGRGGVGRAAKDVVLDGMAGPRPVTTRQLVDALVASKVLRRNGSAVYCSAELGAALQSLARHGLAVEHSLRVTLAAATAGQSLSESIAETAVATEHPEVVQVELAILANGVFSGVVSIARQR